MNIVTDEMVELACRASFKQVGCKFESADEYNGNTWRKAMRAALEAVADRLQPGQTDLEMSVRGLFAAKGRHNTQIAMCRLGDLLGINTYKPGEEPEPAAQGEAVAWQYRKHGGQWRTVSKAVFEKYCGKDGLEKRELCTQPTEPVAQVEAVAKVRHFKYSGVAKNGFSQEAQILDGAPLLEDGTPLYTHPAERVGVPDEMRWIDVPLPISSYPDRAYAEGWNACRATMLAKGDA